MSTTSDQKDKILEQLSCLDDIKARPMMGEYLLYYKNCYFGGIYDGKLLIKETPSNSCYQLSRVVPYSSAKRTMYHVEDLGNQKLLAEIISITCMDLTRKTLSNNGRK